jgi:hypothetical protein
VEEEWIKNERNEGKRANSGQEALEVVVEVGDARGKRSYGPA